MTDVLSHVRLFADQKLRVDRSMAAGEDAGEAQETLGHLEPTRKQTRGKVDSQSFEALETAPSKQEQEAGTTVQ
jgi:hypothetical protein